MHTKAKEALKNAYAPYSDYFVAACIRSEDDTLFVGVNVENSSYGLTLCAESCAIGSMVAAGGKKITSLVLLTQDNSLCPPCGACRQRIFEFSTPDTLLYLCNNERVLKSITVGELLPLAFDLPEKRK